MRTSHKKNKKKQKENNVVEWDLIRRPKSKCNLIVDLKGLSVAVEISFKKLSPFLTNSYNDLCGVTWRISA